MRTRITGTYRGKKARLEIADGEITEGRREAAAAEALGAIRAGAEVSIPGVWSGTASLEDPWAIRALFVTILGDPRFESDEPMPVLTTAPKGTVY
jgi:hypothetical protein